MSDNDTTTATGHIAENLAARFLEKRGLAVKTRNYRCRGGEIDLVCRDGNALVFVEVRLRRNSGFGGAGAGMAGIDMSGLGQLRDMVSAGQAPSLEQLRSMLPGF